MSLWNPGTPYYVSLHQTLYSWILQPYLRPGTKKCYPILDLNYSFLHTTHTCKMDIGHTWYEETPHSKPKKAEPQQKLLEFPVIVLSNKVLIIIIVSIITVFAGVLFVHQPGANHAPRASLLYYYYYYHYYYYYYYYYYEVNLKCLVAFFLTHSAMVWKFSSWT